MSLLNLTTSALCAIHLFLGLRFCCCWYLALPDVSGLQAAKVELAFSDHFVEVGQDIAALYEDAKNKPHVFYGRVWCIRQPVGKSMVECRGRVDLQDRLPGVQLRCCWYEELDDDDTPASLRSKSLACFTLGPALLENCKLPCPSSVPVPLLSSLVCQ